MLKYLKAMNSEAELIRNALLLYRVYCTKLLAWRLGTIMDDVAGALYLQKIVIFREKEPF